MSSFKAKKFVGEVRFVGVQVRLVAYYSVSRKFETRQALKNKRIISKYSNLKYDNQRRLMELNRRSTCK